jgi:hypothetical protein
MAMSIPLERIRREMIRALHQLFDELNQLRSAQLSENENTTRSDYMAKRVEVTKDKLDDLKTLQKREKEVQDRRREIERDNAVRRNTHDK